MTIAPEWGGVGTDYVAYALALMEIAAGDGSISTVMSVQNAPVCAVLAGYGNKSQKERWLRPLASGQMIGSFALTEPGAGSDAASLKTRAVRRGTHYVLDGAKQFISSASIAGVVIVFAVTDPAAGKRGISAFLVPTGSKGFSVSRIEDKLGQKASDTCALSFEGVEIPSREPAGRGRRRVEDSPVQPRAGPDRDCGTKCRHGYGSTRLRLSLRPGAPAVWPTDHRASGGGVSAGRSRYPTGGCPPARVARGPAARCRVALPQRGLHGQTVRLGGR